MKVETIFFTTELNKPTVVFGTCVCVLSGVQLFVTPWTVAHQAPLFMEFSRQDYWSGLPFPAPGDPLNPGSNPPLLNFLHWQKGSLSLYHLESPRHIIGPKWIFV